MTTIAYRDGWIAADSRTTTHSEEGGARYFPNSRKLFPVDGAIIATAGENIPGLLFVDWYGAKKLGKRPKPPSRLIDGDADFTCLVLTKEGLFEYDKWCRGEKVELEFYAVGSGAKAALGAMHMGATAEQAVRIACQIDPYSQEPVTSMALSPP